MKRILLFFIQMALLGSVYGQIIITEIMFDPTPSVGLPEEEYIELQNVSDYPVELNGWIIGDKKQKGVITSGVLLPDSLVILTSRKEVIQFNTYGYVEPVDNWPALNNDGDDIRLFSSDGRVIDSVFYRPSWYNSSNKRDGGWSIERIDISRICQSEDNWAASIHSDGGTPGQVNSLDANNPDLRAPVILQAIYQSPNKVRLLFSENVVRSRVEKEYFRISNGPEVADVYSGATLDTLWLELNGMLEPGGNYEITVSAIMDCAGNLGSSSSLIILPVKPGIEELKINEVLFDPLPGGEDFLEILNTGENFLLFDSLVLLLWNTNASDQPPDELRHDGELLIAPGQWLVISPDALEVFTSYSVDATIPYLTLPSLNVRNDGGLVALYAQGKYQDSAKIDPDFHHALLEDKEGFSLERTDYTISGWFSAAWMTSAKKATPGMSNTQALMALGDQAIMEIQPEVVIPGSINNGTLLIRLYLPNPGITGTLTLFNLNGQRVATISHNELLSRDHVFRWDLISDNGQVALPGYYLLFAELYGPGGFHKVLRKRVLIGH